MAFSAYQRRAMWLLGGLLLLNLRAAALDPEPSQPKKAGPKKPGLYDPKADVREQLKAAVAKAQHGHLRVLVMFGFEGCSWCHKLHALFEQNAELRKLLRDEYVTVLVDIQAPHADELLTECRNAQSREEQQKGVGYPFLAVVDGEGKIVTAQRTNVLEEGTAHDPSRVKAFLDRWATPRRRAGDP